MKARLTLTLILLLGLSACAPAFRDTAQPMATVARLDAERYAGRWYEVASFPVFFQRGCTATTADYDLRPDGVIGVLNTCRKDHPDGPVSQIAGTATVVGPGQLQVRLGRVPFPGDYWVLWLSPDFRTAVVGVPSGRAGWILHRTPEIPETRLRQARAVLEANGYDLTQLQRTRH
ncbi:MAG: lipocalin family protein [Pseudorhodobacter sp.]